MLKRLVLSIKLFIFTADIQINKSVSKVIFKACNQGQGSLFPVSPEDKIPWQSGQK
jgi:hypothetical protein